MVAQGNANKQIARDLGLSDQTVKNHVSSILMKLNASDRTHAVVIALGNYWISSEVVEREAAGVI